MKKKNTKTQMVLGIGVQKTQINLSELNDVGPWYTYNGDFKELKSIQHYLLDGNKLLMLNDKVVFHQDGMSIATCIQRQNIEIPQNFSKNTIEILEIFNLISRPYSGINFKLQAICGFLESINIQPEIQRVKGQKSNIIVKSKSETRKVVMSHYDLISIFDEVFWIKSAIEFDGDEIIGALDNTITNAIVLWMLKNEMIPDDVEIVFSSEEERGGDGAIEYMKSLASKKDISFINLDVTNEFSDDENVGMSIEYDAYNIENFEKLWQFCSDGKTKVTLERYDDDLSLILKYGGQGASFCLPTKKTIHSFKNKTTAQKLETYTEKLISILYGDIDFSKEKTKNIFIKKFKSTKNLSTEEIVSTFSSKPYSSRSLFDDKDFFFKKNFNETVGANDTVFLNGGTVFEEEGLTYQELLDELILTNAPIDEPGFSEFKQAVVNFIDDVISEEEMENIRMKLSPFKANLYKKQFWSYLKDAKNDFLSTKSSFIEANEEEINISAKSISSKYASTDSDIKFLKRTIEGWLLELNSEFDLTRCLLKVRPYVSPSEITDFLSDVYKLAAKPR